MEVQRGLGPLDPDGAPGQWPMETQDGRPRGEAVRSRGVRREPETNERGGLRSVPQLLDTGRVLLMRVVRVYEGLEKRVCVVTFFSLA